MTTISIGPDQIASSGQATSAATQSNTFGNFMDAMSMTASAAGPVLYESFMAADKPGAASIAGAAANSMYGSAMTAGSSNNQYLSTGAMSTSYSGGAYYGGTPSYSTTGTGTELSGSVESILTETATSQAYLIGIQAQLGQQQSTFTAVSNALNVKHGMEKSAIQNFRV
ncbi:MAG: hypothetical protein ABII18_10660 [bacterium]|nr:hypothetical protein [bacterium]MBU1918631.1 hypothetical protein [bacterium]